MHFADSSSGRPFSKDPAVVRFRGRYWLYYSLPPYEGKAGRGWNIGIATSDNLVDWTRAGEIPQEGDLERNGFCAPGAIVIEGRVHLFFQTYGNGPRDAICHAWSDDGRTFQRDPTNPVFRPEGTWNNGRAIDADVLLHGDRLLMYWATRDPAGKVQMLGVSAAPAHSDYSRNTWKQLSGDAPILRPELPWEKQCIEAPAACSRNGRVILFYAGGYNNEPQQIGVAISNDGVRFRRLSETPFLPNGAPGTWNSSESGHPYLFEDEDGHCYLFYQGNNDRGRTWFLSVLPIAWEGERPAPAPERLPSTTTGRARGLWSRPP
ncbi:MAG: family 43 glycosylhydrolase [Lentisphaeria bacterium]|nr:family 43 glycosylhydrolase [Lentisphaeria bacterium]